MPAPRELIAGEMMGALLAATNVYAALKTGYIEEGNITAVIQDGADSSRRPWRWGSGS
jgi:hypothetical protein